MTSQIGLIGDQTLVNTLSGAVTPLAQSSGSPPTFIPGLTWYNTTASAFYYWNNTAWVAGPSANLPPRYIALLTADPVAKGVVNITDPGFVECPGTILESATGVTASNTALRQQVAFTQASATYPSSCGNTAVLTWTAQTTMTVPIGWAALVTDPTVASGLGLVLATWTLAQAYQVNVSQNVQVGIGQLILQGN